MFNGVLKPHCFKLDHQHREGQGALDTGCDERKPVFRIFEKWNSNHSAQLQILARKSKFHLYQALRYDTIQKANNKGAGQTVPMCRLVCALVVHKNPKTGLLVSRPI